MSLRDFINNQQVKNRNAGRSIARANNAKADAIRSGNFKDRVQKNKGLEQEREEGVKNRNIQRRIAKEESNQTHELEKQTKINKRIEAEEKKQTKLNYAQFIESEKQTQEAKKRTDLQEEQKNIIEIDTKIDRVKEVIAEEIAELEKGNNIEITYFLKSCILEYSNGIYIYFKLGEISIGKKAFKSMLKNILKIPNIDVVNVYKENWTDQLYFDYLWLKLFPNNVFGNTLKQEFINEFNSKEFNKIIKNYLPVKNNSFVYKKLLIVIAAIFIWFVTPSFQDLLTYVGVIFFVAAFYFQVKHNVFNLKLPADIKYSLYFILNAGLLALYLKIFTGHTYDELLFRSIFGFILSSIGSLIIYDYIIYIKNNTCISSFTELKRSLGEKYKRIYSFINEYNSRKNKLDYFHQLPSYLLYLKEVKDFEKNYREYASEVRKTSEKEIIKLKIESLKLLRKRINHYDPDNLNDDGDICTTEKRKTLDFEYFDTEEFITILNT